MAGEQQDQAGGTGRAGQAGYQRLIEAQDAHIRVLVERAFAIQANRLHEPLERVRNVLAQADPGNLDLAALALVMAVEHLTDAVEELAAPLTLPSIEWDEQGKAKPLPPL